MWKLKLLFSIFLIGAEAFNLEEFRSNYCYEDTNLRTTAFYFPYNTSYEKIAENGYVCEHFALTSEDLDYMARNSFSISNEPRIVFKNCEIEYFNEYLVSKFPAANYIFFDNCKISLKNPSILAIHSVSLIQTLGFHECHILDNLESFAFEKMTSLKYILIQNSTFQYPKIDGILFSKMKNLDLLVMDNVNLKSVHPGLLSNNTVNMRRISCTSCQLQEIDSFFQKFKKDVTISLNFSNNLLTKLPSSQGLLKNLPSFRELYLSGNKISEPFLKRIHFKAFRNLEVLDLSGNANINKLDYQIFKDTYLRTLNISNVNLKTLEKLGNSNLTSIDLSNNEIVDIHREIFEDLIYLRFLDLSQNKISVLDQLAFKDLRNLETLNLKSNLITEIPLNIFNGLKALTKLDLSGNLLESLREMEKLDKLRELYLRNNLLKMLPSGSLLPTTLRILDVFNNSLALVGQNTFSNLRYLEILDLSYTNNSYLDFDKSSFFNLQSLKILRFQGNKLQSLEDIQFKNYNNYNYLLELDLSFNKIPTVTRAGLEGLTNLKFLNLSNNHIHEIQKDIMKVLNKIQYVDLSGNDIL